MPFLTSVCNEICSKILDTLFPPRQTQLLVRNFRGFSNLPNLNATLPSSILRTEKVVIQGHEITTLLPYRAGLVQALVLEAKFHNSKKAQRILGQILAEYVYIKEYRTKLKSSKLILIPIPLGKKRRKERGYNQIEEIATYALKYSIKAEKQAEISLNTHILRRVHETAPQTTLNRAARLENMKDSFVVSRKIQENLSSNSETLYILVDDVVTTGATLLAAKEALEAAGIKNILLLALAH